MRSLKDVLKELDDAEKEYKEKCLKYGIEEKQKRKRKEENQENIENANVDESVVDENEEK